MPTRMCKSAPQGNHPEQPKSPLTHGMYTMIRHAAVGHRNCVNYWLTLNILQKTVESVDLSTVNRCVYENYRVYERKSWKIRLSFRRLFIN